MLADCDPIAQALDDAAGQGGTRLYRDALAWGAAALKNPAAVPSARMLDAMAKRYANSYTDFVLAQSHAHRAALLCLPFPREIEAHFTQLAAKSIEEQRRIEAADTLPFEAFRRAYLAAETLDPAASPGRALSS